MSLGFIKIKLNVADRFAKPDIIAQEN